MNTRVLFAALGMALILPIPALAADSHRQGTGHYEWRPVPQSGPRASGPSQRRVWVRDEARLADCDCDMMKMRASECMMDMHRSGAGGSNG